MGKKCSSLGLGKGELSVKLGCYYLQALVMYLGSVRLVSFFIAQNYFKKLCSHFQIQPVTTTKFNKIVTDLKTEHKIPKEIFL